MKDLLMKDLLIFVKDLTNSKRDEIQKYPKRKYNLKLTL